MKLLEQRDLHWSACREMLADNADACITTVMAICAASLPREFWEWDPLAVFAELEDFFQCEVSLETENKIHAGMLCTQTDGFFSDPDICRAFTVTASEGDPGPDLLEDASTLGELLWAHYEATLLFGTCELQPGVARIFTDAYRTTAGDQLDDVGTYLYDQEGLLRSQLTRIGCTEDHLAELPPVPGKTEPSAPEPEPLSGGILA